MRRPIVRSATGSPQCSGVDVRDLPDVRSDVRADDGDVAIDQRTACELTRPGVRPHALDPNRLPDHIDRLYRAAWALCGSRQDAEDLVQETFVNVLKRPRLLRDDNEIAYLLRALRNTHADRHRAAVRRPQTRQLFEDDAPAHNDRGIQAREIMQAIASAPALYRDAVIAVDLVGLSYREAARSLRSREATITTRLHRGRQHVARELLRDTVSAA
jgi:RNA polymerase sigma-70 factor (ECF subfamily)